MGDIKHLINRSIKAKRFADGGVPDDDEAAMMPETFVNPLVKRTISGIASLPRRAIEASAQDVGHLGEEGYERQAIGPAAETALMTMGAGAGARGGFLPRGVDALPPRAYTPPHAAEVPTAAAREASVDVGGGMAGAPGGGEGLRQAQLEAQRRAGGHEPLPGLPQGVQIVDGQPFVPGPVANAHDVARSYMADKDFGLPQHDKYMPVDLEHSQAIAKAFDEMPHAPSDPKVKAAYEALARETLAQYRAIKESGLKVTPVNGADYPYHGNPRAVVKDVAENNHMAFFKTNEGFGTDFNADPEHPLLRSSGEVENGHDMLYNDLFRVVHDYFGHVKNGFGFRGAGEDNAWRAHAPMYSPEARRAMTTETRGQNSWLNYGPHGEFNRTANAADTIYAPQKIGVLPDWTMQDRMPRAAGGRVGYADGGAPDDDGAMMPETFVNPMVKRGIDSIASLPQRAFESSEAMRRGEGYDPGPVLEAATLPMGTGAIAGLPVRAGEVALGAGPIRAYHSSPHDFDRFDTSKIGTGEGAQAYGHGLYFAENPKVSGQGGEYWNKFHGRFEPDEQAAADALKVAGFDREKALAASAKNIDELERHLATVPPQGDYSAEVAHGYMSKLLAQRKLQHEMLTSGKSVGPRTYEVDINADPQHLLDWDKPLEKQGVWDKLHPHVRDAIDETMDARGMNPMGDVLEAYKGRELYQALRHHDVHEALPAEVGESSWVTGNTNEKKHTSAYLNSVGVPGIKYLDQLSRPGPGGMTSAGMSLREPPKTSNYVMFDGKLIDIRKKYSDGGVAPRHFADGGAPDADSFGWGKVGEAMPEHIGRERIMDPIANSAISTATLPRRAIENSQRSLETGEYDPGPVLEAAALPLGAGVAGVPVRGAEAVLGAGAIRKAKGATGAHSLPPRDFEAPAEALMPQLAERYPEIAPPVPKVDKITGRPYMGKDLSDEALELKEHRLAMKPDIEAGRYDPYFDPAKRTDVDPSKYPAHGDTGQLLMKKPVTREQYDLMAGNPDAVARLDEAYARGLQQKDAAGNWYFMKQLEDKFVKEYGAKKGRELFKERFADSMAATTGGADPTANLLMAHYGNYLKEKGLPVPPSNEFPYPVGGQYAANNMDQFSKMIMEGRGIDELNPKRYNFSGNFLGQGSRATIDEQMSKLFKPGMQKPPDGSYGHFENVLAARAAHHGVDPRYFQEVAWAGAKDAAEKGGYAAKPMISHVNDAIERTHRVTGMPKAEIVRRALVRAEIPLYGAAGAAALPPLLDNEDDMKAPPRNFASGGRAGYAAGGAPTSPDLGSFAQFAPKTDSAPDLGSFSQFVPQPMSAEDVASGVIENAPSSAMQFLKDTARAVIHPVDTLGGIKDLGLGLLEKSGAVGTIFPGTGGNNDSHIKYADAMGGYLKDRYGGWENIKRSVAKDPVGVLGDASMILTGGGSAAERLPGVLGKTGEVMSKVGRATDPLMAPVNAARVGTKAVGELMTHTGATPLENAYRTGVQGGEAGEVFRDQMRGTGDMTQPVTMARQGLEGYRQARAANYRQGMEGITSVDRQMNPFDRVLDFGKIEEAVDKAKSIQTFKGQVLDKGANAVRNDMIAEIDHWKSLPPGDYHTIEGLDALKRSLGHTMMDTAPGTAARKAAGDIYNAVRNTIVNYDPKYAVVMKQYEQASGMVRELERAMSLGEKASADTALRKLQSIMRNNVNTNYGRRLELGQLLQENGAKHLMAALSGQALNAWAPRGLGKLVPELAVVGAAGHFVSPLSLAALPFMSPRLMGEAAHGLGRTVGRVGEASNRVLGNIGLGGNRTVGNLSYRAGRATNPFENTDNPYAP